MNVPGVPLSKNKYSFVTGRFCDEMFEKCKSLADMGYLTYVAVTGMSHVGQKQMQTVTDCLFEGSIIDHKKSSNIDRYISIGLRCKSMYFFDNPVHSFETTKCVLEFATEYDLLVIMYSTWPKTARISARVHKKQGGCIKLKPLSTKVPCVSIQ
jgi:hypothetical protein